MTYCNDLFLFVYPVSRLVSYGGDEDEDDNAHKVKVSMLEINKGGGYTPCIP
jgi:hypothetical protein